MNMSEALMSRDRHSEHRALKAMLLAGRLHPDIETEHFVGAERRIYEAMVRQYDDLGEVDLYSIRQAHPEADAVTEVGGSISRNVLDSLRVHRIRRGLARHVAGLKYDNPLNDCDGLQRWMGEAILGDKTEEYSQNSCADTVLATIEAGVKNKRAISGYSTGIQLLDNAINGIELSKMIVIGALKKTGKSRLMLYLACRLADAGARVLINSLEMSAEQLNGLAYAYYSGVDSRRLGSRMDLESLQAVQGVRDTVRALPWVVYRHSTTSKLRSRIMHERHVGKLQVVMVDYIQRMQDDRYRRDRVREVERIALDLADITREQNVALIALSQLSGQAEREKGTPSMRDYKESQGIPESADVCITLHDPGRGTEKTGRWQPMRLRVEQRYGVSDRILPLMADLSTCTWMGENEHAARYGRSETTGGVLA